jgi:bifunctional non-homologous end joining protein LigD
MSNFLDEYRRKRAAGRTPEPFGAEDVAARRAAPGAGARVFCVQQHAARRMHHDLRLEWNGVLKSWAVPQGPSLDPKDKRLAVMTEDHPLEYATFEGVIPPGEYGAGEMIVWDHGRYEPVGDLDEGLREGKLLFDLHGYKLRGRFTLVKLKKGEKGNEWLLIKEKDAHVVAGAQLPAASVLTGRTVQQLREDGPAQLLEACAREGPTRQRVDAGQVQLMLAESRDDPFSRAGWLFELKYDGYRMLAEKSGLNARLLSRNGNDASTAFPDLIRALRALPHEHVVLDGEVVVLGEDGRPEFQKLQKRALLTRGPDAERAALELPATLYAFDLLGVGDFDLRPLPLRKRKELLARVAPRLGPIRYCEQIEEHGEALFAQVQKLGLEGMVGKRADAPYKPGRSPDWLKVRIEHADDFAVVGFTLPKGSRSGLGSLHVGGYRDGKLIYAGRAGSGLSDRELVALRERLEADRAARCPCEPHPMLPKGREHVWVAPRLVCEVKYRQITEEGLLRQPTFVRMRDDKRPEECEMPAVRSAIAAAPVAPAREARSERREARREATLVNPEKLFWPADGLTKRDMYEYYRDISQWLLPYLKDRPLVLTRYPDGIEGKSFFQKDARGLAPPWVRTERMWSEDTQRDIDYFIADDLETLLYLVNLGTIPLHVWASHAPELGRPDWSIVDLDPKGAPFADVITLANAVHRLCDDLGLPSYVKTSGQAGLHVLVPLGGQLTHEQSTQLAQLLARTVEGQHADISTTVRQVERRGGKVYLDYLQNGHGKTIAGPFSARPVPGATVSMPLRWSEVNARLDPRKFTLRTAPARMRKLKDDPLAPVLRERADRP